MREIKFRAWDKQENKWYAPVHEAYKGNLFELFVSFSGDLNAHVLAGMEHQSLWPDRFLLMQYTGLKDKNGVEIYEGDIVKGGRNTFKIVWVQTMCCFKKRSIDGNYDSDLWLSESDTLEVIGNIYENPELLETTNDKN